MQGELNSDQINNLLTSQLIGRLACSDGLYPYIIPMAYTYDGNYIFGQTNEGKKLDIIRKNPNIAFQVDSYIDIFNWQSVIIYGQFEEIVDDKDEYAKELILRKIMPLLTGRSIHHHEHATEDSIMLDENQSSKTIIFKILINQKTGRFEKQ
jgi:nitroimidazol reductase NimA-like FMN-containing flavoprotein (pyridoxamine 5'-phosphate oxidase superfamily)